MMRSCPFRRKSRTNRRSSRSSSIKPLINTRHQLLHFDDMVRRNSCVLSFPASTSATAPPYPFFFHSTVQRCRIDDSGNSHRFQQFRRMSSSTASSSSKQEPKQQQNHHRGYKKKDYDYCVDLVQQRDRQSYICGLLMPYSSRKAYFAIRAFNVELASINDGSLRRRPVGDDYGGGDGDALLPDATGMKSLAIQLRMQFWRDALNQIYQSNSDHKNPITATTPNNTVTDNQLSFLVNSSGVVASHYYNNPIVRVLDAAVQEQNLTRRFLERLLEARESHIDTTAQPNDVQEMVDYADAVFSSLFYLSLETVNVREEAADIVAQHAGIGVGLVAALRGARIRLAMGESPIPKSLLAEDFPYHELYRLQHEDDLNVTWTDDERRLWQDAFQEIGMIAYSHLTRAQELQSNVPTHARACFLPVVPAMHYLSKLEQAKFDIFNDKLLEHDHLTVLILLTRSWMTGVF